MKPDVGRKENPKIDWITVEKDVIIFNQTIIGINEPT
jgi:hypothetical protein